MHTTTAVTIEQRGSDIRARREALGITRAALAGILGCTPSYVGSLEDGYQPKRSAVLARLHTTLDEREAAR